MTALRSGLFGLSFAFVTFILAVLGLPFLLMPPESIRLLYRFWTRIMFLLLRVCCGLRYEIRGEQFILPSPAVYAAKHQSALDIFILLMALPRPIFVLKRELLFLPLIGLYFLRIGMIPINRGRGARMLKNMIPAARRTLLSGCQVVIFPEGTRRAPGDPPRYLPGAAALYTKLNISVVPVALNCGLFWRKDAFTKRAGVAVVEFLPPIYPGLSAREFTQKLQHDIEEASTRLCRERKS